MNTGAKPYAGDLSAREAWDLLEKDSNAVLVDCRSSAEWVFVGVADLSTLGRHPIFVPWQTWNATPRPGMTANPTFTDEVARANPSPDTPIVFMCRSGGRSMAAASAMTKRGYSRCYNLAGGFEGNHDPNGHRGAVSGWKAAGLPWAQE